MINSWIEAVAEDRRVHGRVITNGAITSRMSHQSPNMAQIPAYCTLYGKECRELWTVPSGYKLVGIDASGLELRILSHYMNDKEYINEVINGVYTLQIKLLQGWKAEILQKHLSMRSFMGQVTKNSEVSVEGLKSMEERLKKDFLSLYQVLKGCETEWTSLVERISQRYRPKKPPHQTKALSSQHPHPRGRGNSNEESIGIIRQRD